MPHLVYGWISWAQILSPSRDQFKDIFPPIEEAHREAVKKFERKTALMVLQQENRTEEA